MILSDYSAGKRHDILWDALDAALRGLPHEPYTTSEVGAELRLRLRCPATEMPMVLTWLKKVAPLVPEASRTGAVVKAYGHYGRRWIWSKRAGLAAAAAVDASDW